MRRLLAALAVGMLTLSLALPAYAAGITISPPKFEFDATPGQVIRDTIKITNTDPNTLVLTPSVQDFVAGGESGQPKFVDAGSSEAHASISISNWVKVNDGKSVTAAPNKKAEIPFVITVPKDAEPGGHYGAVFFAPPSGEGQIGVTQRIGALVLVRVAGEVTESGTLDTFGSYDEKLEGEELKKASSQFFFTSLPVPFSIRYENTGNIHVKPTGKITITNMLGMTVDPAGVLSVINDAGVEIRKDLVDYIPVNDARGNTLAKSFRTYHAAWAGTPYWYRLDDGSKEIRYKGWPVGLYTATLTLDGAGGQTEEATMHFVIFPWKELGGGALVLVVLVFGFLKYRAWSERRLEEKIKARLGLK